MVGKISGDIRKRKNSIVILCFYWFLFLQWYLNLHQKYIVGMEEKIEFTDLNLALSDGFVFCDDQFFLVDKLEATTDSRILRLDFSIGWCCLAGTATLYLNGERREIRPNNLIICQPNFVVERSMLSMDFDGFGIGLSQACLAQLVQTLGTTWKMKVFLERNPILRLTQENVDSLRECYMLLRRKLQDGRPYHYRKEMVKALMEAMFYELAGILRSYGQDIFYDRYSSGENLFHHYLDLLVSAYPRPRSVAWYARQLNVTPKYLSAICKQIGGKTASDLLNTYVLNDVKAMLGQSGKSIKEVAYALGFSDLSVFGRYVKKNLGFSPRRYREQSLKSRENGEDSENGAGNGCPVSPGAFV